MRGKEAAAAKKSIDTRITPAYAGKSAGVANTPLEIKDHPRLCGEKLPAVELRRFASGSPPPMRGKD